MVHVLEQQRDRLPLAEAFQQPQHCLEHARLTPLGGDDARPVGQQSQGGQSRPDDRHQASDHVAGRARQGCQHLVGDRLQEMLERRRDRGVRDPGGGRHRDPVNHGERLRQRADATPRLAQKPGEAETGGARKYQRIGLAVCRVLEADRDPIELTLTADEPVAPELAVRGAAVEPAFAAPLDAVGHGLTRSQLRGR